MAAYILRRLALLVPTFFGIIALNFFVIQSAPGGPVEQYLLRLEGADSVFMERVGGESGDTGIATPQLDGGSAAQGDGLYKGQRGLSPEVVEAVRRMYGFDRPVHERFWLMLRNYLTFDFGDSFFKGRSVMQLLGDALPVSISLGLWSTLIIYFVSIPLGIRRAVRHGSRFDAVTGTLVVIGDAIPGFLFAVLLVVLFAGGSYWNIFPLRGLVSPDFAQMTLWQKIGDYFSHLALPLTSLVIGGFATLTTLTRNSFLDEIHRQYTATALAKGLTMRQVLYGHVFRNAMLIVIAGFPGTFIHMFFTGSVLIEVIFSLNGLGLLGFEAAMTRDYPVMFATLYMFTLLGLLTRIITDITYSLVDPRITFGGRGWPVAEFSPHTVRKLAAFRAHRRGWYSLWVLAVFFALSMCAELVANDKPLLVSYKGEWFVPVFKSYQETQFGGVLPVEADYRDPAVSEAIRGHGFMIWPPVRFSYDTVNYAAELYPAPPSAQNWLGTDDQGRDIVARVLYGFRLSILFGFGLCLVSSAVGITAGAVQGYYGGAVDLVFQRFMEIWSGMPVLYLLIILSSIVTMGFWSLLGVMLLFSWMGLVHVVRAEFLRCRQLDYVRAARAIGVRDSTIMFRHILPNAMVATISYLPFIFSGAVTTLTSLDFIGFGMPPGSPSLGELLAQGKNNLQAPWIGLTAFGVLGTLLCLLVFIGEAVRDAFDPNGGKKS